MSSGSSFTFTLPPQGSSTASPGGGGGDGGSGGGGGGSSSNSNLANSASLYLYTFLATLVLLLSVSGAIVVRSFIIRRRHRRMVEEAIRNGTWIPPAPTARGARVDLSKKPELWEAYLGGGGGWKLGSGKEFEYSRDWESIKPIYAGYTEPLTSVPYSGSAPNPTGVPPPASMPIPTSTNLSAPRRDDEENRRTGEASSGAPPSLLTRARIFLNANSSTVPISSSGDSGNNSRSISANISMTELSSNSPPTIRVAVLIAMPSPTSSHRSSTPLSASLSSSSSSNKSQPHPLDLSLSSPTTLKFADDEEQPLPHLEMGVADVVLSRSEKSSSSSWDSGQNNRKEEKTIYSRGSSYAEP